MRVSQRLPNDRRPEPPQKSGEPDVGGDDAQPPAGIGDLDVVDANDLSAVDVDDLLVEQIGDEIELLLLGRRGFFRRHRQCDVSIAVDVGDGLDRREAQALRGLDDQPVDLREDRFGLADDEVGDLTDRQVVDRRAPPNQIRDEPLGERHDRVLFSTLRAEPAASRRRRAASTA